MNESLSQGQQQIFDTNQASDYNLAQYGNQQTQELLKRGGTPFEYNTGQHEAWAGDLYNKLNTETNAQNDQALRSRLAAQGVKQGSAAYDREMASYSKGRDNARNQFLLDSQSQGYQQAMATRNQQTNEPLAIATGTQIQLPNFNPGRVGNVATTDMASIYNNYDQARMQAAQMKQANLGGLFSGIGSMFALSDRRAKTGIKKVGMANGLNLYTYEYKKGLGPIGRQIGVMAQEVAKKIPEAVAKGADGLFRVNYSKAFSLGA